VQRIAIALTAALVAGAAPSAVAGQLLDVAVIDRATGRSAPVYAHQGRLYVAGAPGERYAVRIANRTGARILAAVSVDGVNAVTGETAAPDQTGYVLAAQQSFDVAGWRKSTTEVAAFTFTRLADSYAARTGRPDHVGVIGVAVFREWSPPRPAVMPHPRPLARADGAARESQSAGADPADAPAASAPAETAGGERPPRRREQIGTGHGERERSDVAYTQFRRATSAPAETIAIYYDTRANLVARGIIPGTAPVSAPDPFPARRFVPDPRS